MGRRGRRHQQLLGTLTKREGTGTWKKKQYIAPLENLLWKKACCKTDYIMSGVCVGLYINIMWSFPRVTNDGDKVGLQNVGH